MMGRSYLLRVLNCAVKGSCQENRKAVPPAVQEEIDHSQCDAEYQRGQEELICFGLSPLYETSSGKCRDRTEQKCELHADNPSHTCSDHPVRIKPRLSRITSVR